MSAETIVVIDAGTSNLRAVAVTRGGDVSLIGTEPWPMFVPDDTGPFGRELRPDETRAALRRLVERVVAIGDRISAIATCGQREGVALCDVAGEPLLISPNIDARASAEGMAIDAAHGEEVYRTYGRLPSLIMAPAKMQWLRTNRPHHADRVRWVVPLADWIGAELCGERVVSRSLGPEIGVADVENAMPEGELAELLPKVSGEGTVVGHARDTTLAGVPVVNAGADTQCALLGARGYFDGQAGVIAGWSASVQRITGAPEWHPEMRTWVGRTVLPADYVAESNAGDAGRAWSWACTAVDISAHDADVLASQSPVGANDAMAILSSRAMNAAAMSAGVGAVVFPLPLAMASPSRADLLRGVLEGIACAVRSNFEQVRDRPHDFDDDGIALGGGMSGNATFVRILADVLGYPLRVAASTHTSALGAAVLASGAQEGFASNTRVVEPDPKASAIYEDIYGRWCEAAERLEREPL